MQERESRRRESERIKKTKDKEDDRENKIGSVKKGKIEGEKRRGSEKNIEWEISIIHMTN